MKKLILFCVIGLLLAAAAIAQEPTPVLSFLEQTSISGFVDASYYGNLNTKHHSFSLDQGEIDIVRDVEEYGIVLRVDMEWVSTGNTFFPDLEQGYMNYTLPFAQAIDFTFGKFNAPIGFELLDPNEMYQYSHSLLFDFTLPTNLTGVMGSVQFTDRLDLSAYVCNGWDRNVDNNSTKTFGGRFGIALDKANIGLSTIMGVFDAPQNRMRTVFDVDFGVLPAENWLIGGEFNMGTISVDNPNVDDATWTGFMVMTHVDLNDWFGLTGRYDMIDDADGAIFGVHPVTMEGYTRSSITVAPTFVLGPGLGALVEFRMDTAGEEIFQDDKGATTEKSTSMVAFEMTYSF